MNHASFSHGMALPALALAPVLITGCNKKLHLPSVTTLRPVVRFTAAPIDTIGPYGKRASYIYHYLLNCLWYDPDCRVDHFMYKIALPWTPRVYDTVAT